MVTITVLERRLDGALEPVVYGFDTVADWLTMYRPAFQIIVDIVDADGHQLHHMTGDRVFDIGSCIEAAKAHARFADQRDVERCILS